MIQRIQSLYLLLACGALLLLAFFPMATLMSGSEEMEITLRGIRAVESDELIVPVWQMAALWMLSALLPLVTLFLFRFRWLQLRLCVVEIVLLVGLQIYVAYYVLRAHGALAELPVSSMKYSPVDVMPIVAIILVVMAFRGVVRDQALIRSLDRIR